MIVAIDGTAGSGKSSIADMVSHRFDFVNLNSGNLYRAVTLYLIGKNVDLKDERAVEKAVSTLKLSYIDSRTVSINKKEVSYSELHTPDIDKHVGVVSNYLFVRDKINKILNDFAKHNSVVCEGRDIGSVVFPSADVKIFMDADPRERAFRRASEYGESRDEVISDLIIRDKEDREREVGALVLSPGAVKIDTTGMTLDDVYKKVAFLIREKMQEIKT